MKKRNLIIIAVVALVGIAALIVALQGRKKSTFDQDYNIKDIAAVDRVFLADKQGHATLRQRETDSSWSVVYNDIHYTANQPMVDLLLETLHTMQIRQQVNRNAIPNVVKDISARAVKVEIYGRAPRINIFGLHLFEHEKKIVTYYVGRETQDMLASYMFREGDKVPYIIHIPGFRGFLTPRFVADPIKWRSHTIVDLDVNAIAEINLQIPASPSESFSVRNNGDGFDLIPSATGLPVPQFDTVRVAQLLSSFAWLNFDEFASIVPNANDSSLSAAPRAVLTITDTTGRQTEVRTYIKYYNPDDREAMPDSTMFNTFDLDRLYAIIDSKDTVLIQYFVFDRILQPVSYFLGHDKSTFAK